MTIAALRRLLDEEMPDVTRHPAPQIPQIIARKRKHMTESLAPRPSQAAPSAGLTVATTGALIAWAEMHPTKSVARKGEQARALLRELRELQTAEEELTKAEAEEQRLLQQLQVVRARREQLRPRRKTQAAPGYDQAAVRAWAREHGHTVADRGSVPAPVVEAWRAAQTGGAH